MIIPSWILHTRLRNYKKINKGGFMRIRIFALFILAACSACYCAIEIMPVSPYIKGGASMIEQYTYNQYSLIHYYKKGAEGNKYPIYSNTVYLTQYDWFMGMMFDSKFYGSNGTLNFRIEIGDEKQEKLEVAFFLSAIPVLDVIPFSHATAKLRIKYNFMEEGEDRLFKNVAITFFGGVCARYLCYSESDYHGKVASNKGTIMLYNGAAIGTRKKTDDFSYFEIFTSPQISFTYFGRLGGLSFDPANFLEGYEKYPRFGLWFPDFTMPVGIGRKHRNFIARTGGAFSTTIGNDTRNLNRDGAPIDKVVFNSNNFSFFFELGIHFRKFKEMEKEANSD
jgi:hypothetical protein